MRVHFEGLCAIAPGLGSPFVLTPIGHHTPHTSLMAADATDVDWTATTWQPDLVIKSLNDKAMALWWLRRTVVTLGEPGEAVWGIASPHLLNFRELNPSARYVECPAAISGGVIHLGRGTLSADEKFDRAINIIKKTPTNPLGTVTTDTPNQRITWGGDARVDGGRAGKIAFCKDAGKDPELWITNTATGDGLSHFHNYYDLVKKDDTDGEVVLEYAGQKRDAHPFFGHGLNCVPPVMLPTA